MIVAVICARAGSKGVEGKNGWVLRGTPLIARAVRTATETRVFDLVVASSDSSELLDLATEAGADLAVSRPDDLASDAASKLDAIRHAVLAAEEHTGQTCQVAIDLDVTTPLRTASDVLEAFALLDDPAVDRVFTATPARRSPYFNQAQVGDDGVPGLPCGDGMVVRRQDAPEVFDLTGAVYVWRRSALFGPGPLLQPGARLHVLPPERAWDIDTELDLLIVEAIAERGAG